MDEILMYEIYFMTVFTDTVKSGLFTSPAKSQTE